MKLELKHLSGYLPYSVHLMNEYGRWHNTTLNKGLSIYEMLEMKPILRPLSELTKEIEEDFNVYSILSLRSKNDFDSGNPLILKWSFEDIQKLLQYHFDIYGLIENSLAIDINTL